MPITPTLGDGDGFIEIIIGHQRVHSLVAVVLELDAAVVSR
jgi:hypothetical protein